MLMQSNLKIDAKDLPDAVAKAVPPGPKLVAAERSRFFSSFKTKATKITTPKGEIIPWSRWTRPSPPTI